MMINVEINQQTFSIASKSSVLQAAELFGALPPYAIALNSEFVSQADYASTDLNEGDKLDIVSPIHGG